MDLWICRGPEFGTTWIKRFTHRNPRPRPVIALLDAGVFPKMRVFVGEGLQERGKVLMQCPRNELRDHLATQIISQFINQKQISILMKSSFHPKFQTKFDEKI